MEVIIFGSGLTGENITSLIKNFNFRKVGNEAEITFEMRHTTSKTAMQAIVGLLKENIHYSARLPFLELKDGTKSYYSVIYDASLAYRYAPPKIYTAELVLKTRFLFTTPAGGVVGENLLANDSIYYPRFYSFLGGITGVSKVGFLIVQSRKARADTIYSVSYSGTSFTVTATIGWSDDGFFVALRERVVLLKLRNGSTTTTANVTLELNSKDLRFVSIPPSTTAWVEAGTVNEVEDTSISCVVTSNISISCTNYAYSVKDAYICGYTTADPAILRSHIMRAENIVILGGNFFSIDRWLNTYTDGFFHSGTGSFLEYWPEECPV